MMWPDERWAVKLVDKHHTEPNKTIVELRTKLEIRTWALRASLTLNMGIITGIIAAIIVRTFQ